MPAAVAAWLTVSGAAFFALALRKPGGEGWLAAHLLADLAGAAAAMLIFLLRGEAFLLFGKRKEEAQDWNARVRCAENPEAAEGAPAAEAQQGNPAAPESSKSLKPRDIAAAISGLKVLLESVQVTDEETWREVAEAAREAAKSLAGAEEALRAAAEACGAARKAVSRILDRAGGEG
jgi:hypothetical protein